MSRYFKGTSKKNGIRAVYELYDEPKIPFMLKEMYIMEAHLIDRTGTWYYETKEECEKEYNILEEIGKEEYMFFCNIQSVMDAIYSHGFPNAFYRNENVRDIMTGLDLNVRKVLEEFQISDKQ